MKIIINYVFVALLLVSFIWLVVNGVRLKIDYWDQPITNAVKFKYLAAPTLALVLSLIAVTLRSKELIK